MSEIHDTEELPEIVFPINLQLVNQYQQKYPSLMENIILVHTKQGIFVEEAIYILTL